MHPWESGGLPEGLVDGSRQIAAQRIVSGVFHHSDDFHAGIVAIPTDPLPNRIAAGVVSFHQGLIDYCYFRRRLAVAFVKVAAAEQGEFHRFEEFWPCR